MRGRRLPAVPRPSRQGLLTVVLVVAALAAGRSVEALTDDEGGTAFGRPWLHPVTVGESVTLRYASLTPEKVDGAPVLDRGRLAPMQSPGLWVVTHVSVTPTSTRRRWPTRPSSTVEDASSRRAGETSSPAPQPCPAWPPPASSR